MILNRRIFLMLVAPVLLVVGLAACSDEKQVSKDQPVADASNKVSPVASHVTNTSGYRVLDTFNVGDNVYVRSMAVDKKSKSLWVGTSVGVLEVSLTDNNLAGTYTREHGLANEYVFGMHVDAKGNRWFGTNGGGISRYSVDKKWKTYFPMHGLADYWVYSFTEQADGTLWIGTWAGLNRFDPVKEKFHTYIDELVN
ncbi:MAG: hypothetical protein KAU29_02780, partial [Gammaproteobacteria bacterium]|nr:hypothetical protein [Gammaproteobacteria bacterium]